MFYPNAFPDQVQEKENNNVSIYNEKIKVTFYMYQNEFQRDSQLKGIAIKNKTTNVLDRQSENIDGLN